MRSSFSRFLPSAAEVERQLAEPFLDEQKMTDPTPLRLDKEAFRQPRLRQYPLSAKELPWHTAKALGSGIDGYVWKLTFDDGSVVAVKMVCDVRNWWSDVVCTDDLISSTGTRRPMA